MYCNFHDQDLHRNFEIQDKITEICGATVAEQMDDFRIIGGNFIMKGKGKASNCFMHQDWNIVDESKYHSLTIWIPLIDVDEDNGCLQVLPGSHRWFNSFRSDTISSLSIKFDYKINSFLTALPAKAGDAVVFNSRVFHGSKLNLSSRDRPALVITLIGLDATHIHYHSHGNDQADILDCDTREEFSNSYLYYKGQYDIKVKVLSRVDNAYQNAVDEKAFFKRLYQEKGSNKWHKKILQKIIRSTI